MGGSSDATLKLIPDVEDIGTGFTLRKVTRDINALDTPLGFYDFEMAVSDAYEDDGITYPAEIFLQAANRFTVTVTIT